MPLAKSEKRTKMSRKNRVTIRIFVTLLVFLVMKSSGWAAELQGKDVMNPEGDGPDGKGNTADDTWQFWFELSHKRSQFQRCTIATAAMPENQKKNGIPRKVRGPVAGLLPNPTKTEGWILHTDWDGRFEGVWADQTTNVVLAHPYVEKESHCAVAITYLAQTPGTYEISGKLTDVQIRPNYPKHDGILWRVEQVRAEKSVVLGKGGPIGDGHGRPDSATIQVIQTAMAKDDLIRLVIHPNQWWGQDLTRIDGFRVEPIVRK